MVRDFLKAAERVWGDSWGHASSMVTRPVTLKAMLRVLADLARLDADPVEGRQARWEARLLPWEAMRRDFRTEGFYERFPARGQVERVARVYRELARPLKLLSPQSAEKDPRPQRPDRPDRGELVIAYE
jgi:hypothetical protein